MVKRVGLLPATESMCASPLNLGEMKKVLISWRNCWRLDDGREGEDCGFAYLGTECMTVVTENFRLLVAVPSASDKINDT